MGWSLTGCNQVSGCKYQIFDSTFMVLAWGHVGSSLAFIPGDLAPPSPWSLPVETCKFLHLHPYEGRPFCHWVVRALSLLVPRPRVGDEGRSSWLSTRRSRHSRLRVLAWTLWRWTELRTWVILNWIHTFISSVGGLIRDGNFLALVLNPPLPREWLTVLLVSWIVWISLWSFLPIWLWSII